MKALLEVRQLCSGYEGVPTLHSVCLEVESGEAVAVLGPNGAGKSTLLRTISGLVRAFSGSVVFAGHDVTVLPPEKRVVLGIVQVPEGNQVFGSLSVIDNILLGAYTRYVKDKARVQADLEEILDMFPRLRERRRQPAGTLSGGERRMLGIARALMAKPKLLLLDELSQGLAPVIVQMLFGVVRRFREQGGAVLLVEQDTRAALELADRAYVLSGGRVVFAGEAGALSDAVYLSRLFGGEG